MANCFITVHSSKPAADAWEHTQQQAGHMIIGKVGPIDFVDLTDNDGAAPTNPYAKQKNGLWVVVTKL